MKNFLLGTLITALCASLLLNAAFMRGTMQTASQYATNQPATAMPQSNYIDMLAMNTPLPAPKHKGK